MENAQKLGLGLIFAAVVGGGLYFGSQQMKKKKLIEEILELSIKMGNPPGEVSPEILRAMSIVELQDIVDQMKLEIVAGG